LREITIDSHPTQEELDALRIFNHPIWSKGVSEFQWTFNELEVCYFLEGEAIVIPNGGEPIRINRGDLVTFPQGLSCSCKIVKDVKKHFRFG
jgi:hypothetical protein